jgi:hypothetical protein
MLVGSGYTPNKGRHSRRSHVGNEIIGGGYTVGGTLVSGGVTINQSTDKIYIVLGSALWPDSTITADGAVYYNSRGGDASDDELLAFIEFTKTTASINGDFIVSESRMWVDNSHIVIA